MENQNSNLKVVITLLACITIVAVSIIISGYLSNINDRNNMSKNMDSAIQRGIDPISVKCAYATQTDNLCMVYALKAK